jgi:dolichol-phosphate mannosyltransferase
MAEDVALSVVVPCYNEEDVLAELRRRLVAVCESLGVPFEIVLVDDGSSDRTRGMIEGFVTEDARFVGVFLSRNHGQQLALTAGLSGARGARILILDADLQDPPELLPQMMALLDQGHDVVYGQRRRREGETAFKRTTSKMFYRMINRMIEVKIPNDTGDFRLMSRRVLDQVLAMPEQHRFVRGMISWVGFSQVPLLYDRDERFAGSTKWALRSLMGLTVDALTSFSIVPLRLATWLGLITAMLIVPLMIYILVSWLSGVAIEGWVSLAAIVTIFGSTQLIVVGIIGEYVGRMYMQGKNRPLFIVDRVVRHVAEAEVEPPKPAVRAVAGGGES